MGDSNSNDPVIAHHSGLTRRDFIAGASAAGVALLASATTAEADDKGVNETKVNPGHHHEARPTFVAVTAGGQVVTCDDQGGVHQRGPELNPVTTFKVPGRPKASCLALSSAGKVLVSFFDDGVVRIFDLNNPAVSTEFKDHFLATGKGTEVWSVAVNSAGTMALSATNGGEIRYWEIAGRHTVARVTGDDEAVGALAFIPGDDYKFLSGHADGRMFLWSIANNTLTRQTFFDHLNASPVNSISAFKKDGNGPVMAITGSFDGNVRVWDLGDLNKPPELNDKPTVLPIRHRHFVWRVAVSPNQQKFASAGEDGKVYVFDREGTRVPGGEIEEKEGVMGVAFASDSKIVYTTGTIAEPQVRFKDV